MVLKSKNGSKTEFYGNGFLATLGSTLQEGQNGVQKEEENEVDLNLLGRKGLED
jgi:hypothetical protein